MTTISLRAYNRQINQMIENGEAALAIAHCHHVLERYPKCVDTYRLLGTGYLENSQFTEASDIFLRLLSAVPDDRLAHIGMSVIREHDGILDEAIWHMERANELQPANRLLQDELRRMYRLRDGLEPTRLHLTRAALARLYFKGRLYTQAISEIDAILSEQPERLDLQLLLARTYDALGNREKTCITCKGILEKLPYCLEANLMMIGCREENGLIEGGEIFAIRASELDPYTAHTTEQQPSAEEIPDLFVTLEWLEIQAESKQPQPGPTSHIPPGYVNKNLQKDQLPDWIQDLESEINTITESGEVADQPERKSIPDEDRTHPVRLQADSEKPVVDEDTKPIRVKHNHSLSGQEEGTSSEAGPDHDISPTSGRDDRYVEQDPPEGEPFE